MFNKGIKVILYLLLISITSYLYIDKRAIGYFRYVTECQQNEITLKNIDEYFYYIFSSGVFKSNDYYYDKDIMKMDKNELIDEQIFFWKELYKLRQLSFYMERKHCPNIYSELNYKKYIKAFDIYYNITSLLNFKSNYEFINNELIFFEKDAEDITEKFNELNRMLN